jgi:hypothetical protein
VRNNIDTIKKNIGALIHSSKGVRDNIDTIKKNIGALIHSSKGVVREINVERTMYILLCRRQNTDPNREIKIANRWFENVPQFRYLGTTVTNQNLTFCLLVCCSET